MNSETIQLIIAFLLIAANFAGLWYFFKTRVPKENK